MTTETRVKYPNRLRILRTSRGMLQKEVGQRLGITEASVNRHENGNRSLGAFEIEQYARLYNVTPYELFNEATPEKEA